MTTATRPQDVCKESTGQASGPSESLFCATDLSKPSNSRLAKGNRSDVRLAAATPTEAPAGTPRLKFIDPNNEKEVSDYASKQIRRELGLKPDASSKDLVEGYMGATVQQYRKLPAAEQEAAGKLNGLDPKKTYTDRELQDIFTKNAKDYYGIKPGPDQDKELEGAIVHDLFKQNQDIQRLKKFFEEDK